MLIKAEIYAVTLGQAVAALSPSIIVAALFNPFLLVLFSVRIFATQKFHQLTVTDLLWSRCAKGN
jgi:hypothetical protein